jgi:signal transduction histidine kinase
VFSDRIRITSDISAGALVTGDARRLRQVFWNLLINACQAMPDGGSLTVEARSVPHGDDTVPWCEIVITDTGQGMAKEHMGKIFDPFFTTKTGGSGLGLAIAYRIIEDHQGTISARSELGRGAQFLVSLPLSGEALVTPDRGAHRQEPARGGNVAV